MQRRDTGRPEIAYGRLAKFLEIEHEVRLTDLALALRGWTFERGIKAGRAEPDAVMTQGDARYFVEVDNKSKQSAEQYAEKWQCYKGTDGGILVVAVTEARMERVRQWSKAVKDRVLFTTFERLSSRSPTLVDWYGITTEL